MRTVNTILAFGFAFPLAVSTGSAAPAERLVSPAITTIAGQFLECTVVNTDDRPHSVDVQFYDSTGTRLTFNAPQVVEPHGSAGVSVGAESGANHCEIVVDGKHQQFVGSIDVIDSSTGSVVVALPIPVGGPVGG